ncbi:hypothetical protein HID58_000989, partial [Brassica napus]
MISFDISAAERIVNLFDEFVVLDFREGIYAHIHSIVLRRIVRDCTYLAPDKNGGVILIFKGIIESIPEVYALLNVMRVLGLLVHGVVAVKVSTLLLPYYFSIPSQLSQ